MVFAKLVQSYKARACRCPNYSFAICLAQNPQGLSAHAW